MPHNLSRQSNVQPQDVRAAVAGKSISGALQSKNVRIHNHRTSVRLEPEMWSALNEIAEMESCSIHDLCGAVHDLKSERTSFTAALRVFLMEYYRTAARTNMQVNMVQKQINRVQGTRAPVASGTNTGVTPPSVNKPFENG